MRSARFKRSVPTIQSYLNKAAHPLRRTGGRRSNLPVPRPGLPTVSIITVVRNRRDLLSKAIESVLAQTYSNIEYIIVDGASTDGTLEIIKKYNSDIDVWISEPDLNPADAFNKGISLATGAYVTWLSSDDWYERDFVQIAVDKLQQTGVDFVHGDLSVYDGDSVCFLRKGDANYGSTITSGELTINAPTMVMRRASFERIGLLDVNLEICCDYEWILRLHLSGGRGIYDSQIIANFRMGGISSKSSLKHSLENISVLRRNGLPVAKPTIRLLRALLLRVVGGTARSVLPHPIYKRLRNIIGRPVQRA